MPRTKRQTADVRKAEATQQDAVSSSTDEAPNSCKMMQLQNFMRELEEVKVRMRQSKDEKLAALDRHLAVVLAQIPEEILNHPPGWSSAESEEKKSLSSDFIPKKILSCSTSLKPAAPSGENKTPSKSRALSSPPAGSSVRAGPKALGSPPTGSRARAAPKALTTVKTKAKPLGLTPTTVKASTSTRRSRPRGRSPRRRFEETPRDMTPLTFAPSKTGETTLRPRTRSMSRERSLSVASVLYQTPQQKSKFLNTLAVTPKMDPYGPVPVKRMPKDGEMAISMTGSPLMVTPASREPNVSIPFNDAVYCIMSTAGELPSISGLDEATKHKLRVLRENMNKILGE